MVLKSQYKREFENIAPRYGFEEETIAFLRQAVIPQHKEEKSMISKRMKIIIAAVAAAFLLVSTVFASSALLGADDVAEALGREAMAEAFRSDDAVIIDQTIQSNGYDFTLMGIVSGKGLNKVSGRDIHDSEIDRNRSYIVLSVANTDGTPVDSLDGIPTFTPLVDGYKPWEVNIFSLNAYRLDTTANGIRYCLLATDSIEIFADHHISIAVYDGVSPGPEIFTMDDNGVISYNDSYTGTQAMFDLPLDPAKADPAAVAAFIESREAEASIG